MKIENENLKKNVENKKMKIGPDCRWLQPTGLAFTDIPFPLP